MLDLYCKDSIVNKKIHLDTTKPATTHGNIYNNQGEGIAFYIQLPSGANGMELSPQRYLITEMRRQPNGEYTLDYRNSPFVGTFQELNEESGFYTTPNSNGKLYFRGRLPSGLWVNSSRFMVTVLQDGDIRPGDDFLLQFALKEKGSVTGIASEEDFCAVYDHKMLWRANLYIDGPIGDEIVDWNNNHPWDSDDNAWNYDFDGENFTRSNGGQTISFREDNAVRPLRYGGLVNAVAYDWPDATTTKTLEQGGSLYPNLNISQGIDSPFDFIYKMYSQQQFLQASYADQQDNAQIQQFQTIGINQEGNVNVNASLLKTWPSLYAPTTPASSHWMNYIKEDADGDFRPYLPGLGLLNHNLDNQYPSQAAWFNGINLNNDYFTAGVDCCGFVYGASDYANAPYEWSGQIADDCAESYARNESSDMGDFNERNRYPVNFSPYHPSHHFEIISRMEINNGDSNDEEVKNYFIDDAGEPEGGGPTIEDFMEYKSQFLQIKPGDIIYYGTSHIGMIDSIDRQAIIDATSIVDIMRGITTIESVYGGYISFVIKRSMMDGIDRRNLNNQNDAIGSWHVDWFENLRSWTIVRLEATN